MAGRSSYQSVRAKLQLYSHEGKAQGYVLVERRLQNHGVGYDYYKVKLDLAEDIYKVIEKGPWMININYLAVKHWSPTFNPSEVCFGHTLV